VLITPQRSWNASLVPEGRGLERLDLRPGEFMRMLRMYRNDAIEASS
jgi:hypothetical protein